MKGLLYGLCAAWFAIAIPYALIRLTSRDQLWVEKLRTLRSDKEA